MISAPPQNPSYAQGFARRGESVNLNLWHGLIGAWRPPLGPTGGTLFDQSGYGRDGTISGSIAWDTDQPGHVLSCPGSDGSHILFANDAGLLPNTGVKTYVAHVKPDSSLHNRLFGFSGVAAPGLSLHHSDTGKPIAFGGGNNYRYWDASAWDILKDGNWHVVAFVIYGTAQNDITKAEMWIDGKQQPAFSTTNTGSPFSFTLFEIGGYTYEYDGLLGMFAVWDRVLLPGEHEQLYLDPAALFRPRRFVPPDGLPAVSDRPGRGVLTGGRM